ncbi:MAG: DUF2807 domain-containing protein [Bacteroidia bacterium]|nr:DUF2807 domain-containing protein [Bacteroidia bacterium]
MRYPLLFLFALSFFGCSPQERWDCVKGTGDEITELRDVSPFSEIYLENKIDVELVQDSVYRVEITGGKNLMPKILATSDGKVLHIREENKCDFMRTYKRRIRVKVHVTGLKKILHEGTGELTSKSTFRADTIDLIVSNAGNIQLDLQADKVLTHMGRTGDITLTGSCGEHACYAMGNGFLEADGLQTNYTWMHWNCTGNARVRASSLLHARLFWTGDVSYTGGPVVISEVLGTGKLLAY